MLLYMIIFQAQVNNDKTFLYIIFALHSSSKTPPTNCPFWQPNFA